MSRPLRASMNLSALSHNLVVARRHGGAARILAVVKANGYGHGLLRVARALASADGFGVLTLEEAVTLREAGFLQPVVPLEGFFSTAELAACSQHNFSPVLHEAWQLEAVAHTTLPSPVAVFLKLNTGMNRLGFAPGRLPELLARLRATRNVESITLMTHFARADEPDGIEPALTLFRRAAAVLDLPLSLANSAALLRHPDTQGDWVRPGIMLYGASPFPEQAGSQLGLKPVMSLTSRIIAVQFLRTGEAVGYGGAFVADRDMRVGIVACGYADGYPRHASTGTPILVCGQRTRTLGRVSMDMLFADLTDLPQVTVGSEATLWGEGLPVEEVAGAAGTISYELLTALAARVPVVEV
jgi:alanine racemase